MHYFCVSQKKTPTQIFVHIFAIYWPIFKISLPLHSAVNLQYLIKDPTIPKTRRYTTLWNIAVQKLNLTNSAATAVIKTFTQIIVITQSKVGKIYCYIQQ